MSDVREIPSDFPRDFMMGSVSGAQPKLLARKIGERFVVGQTEEEVYERWSALEEKAQKLADDTIIGMKIGEVRFLRGHYIALDRGIQAAGWDITRNERGWLMSRISQLVEASTGEAG